jgi:oligopeptide/dipeptide ABC transporter ATP-binding protein
VSILSVQDLTVSVITGNTPLDITRNISLKIDKGEILGVVGESGCGKSMTALAIMGLLPKTTIAVRSGRVLLDDKDITNLEPHQRVDAGLSGVSMIFQEPMTSLNPVMRVGDQIIEALLVHDQGNVRAPAARAKELLDLVHIPDAAMQLNAYPHELSGGMRQRIMIAIALACNPQVLVADEPTTALDVTIQAQILSLLRELCEELSMAVLFITHDLGVVAQLADRVCVMYAGQAVETASVEMLFENPVHPYTHGLFSCLPDPTQRSEPLNPIPGQAPLLTEITDGCAFAPRCEFKTATCLSGSVGWTGFSEGHKARCHHPLKEQN